LFLWFTLVALAFCSVLLIADRTVDRGGHNLHAIADSTLDNGGVPGDTIYIESSGDLVNWNTISTNVLSGGSYIFTDTASSNYSRQFYRARYQ